MKLPMFEQIEQELEAADLSKLARTEVSLLILGWAKLSAEEKIPAHTRLTFRLLDDPKRVEDAVEALCESSDDRLRVFSEVRQLLSGKSTLLIPALRIALQLVDVGLIGHDLGGVLLADFATSTENSHRLESRSIDLMFDIAAVGPDQSVYLPWDSLGQLAARTALAGASAFIETSFRSLIPHAVALSCAKPFNVKFSDPIRSPSFVEKGKPIKFDRAVCFPPLNFRHEATVAKADWFNRFPEATGVGTVLAVRHLLWQTMSRVVVAVSNNLLFSTGVEQALREDLVSNGIIEAVVAMHSGLLPETNVPFSILLLDPRGGHDQIRFVRGDADRFVESESKARFRLKGLRELAEVIQSDQDTPDARTVRREEIGPGAQLQPNRYVLPEGTRKLLQVLSSAQTISLGELVRTIRPMSAKPGKGQPLEVGEIGAADLPAHGYIRQPGRTIQVDSQVSAMNEEQFLRANDVVLIVKGSVGKVGIVPECVPGPGPNGWVAGQSAIVLRLKEPAKVDARALALQLRSEIGQSLLKNIVSGATIPLIQLRELMAMSIVLPSAEEQRRAAQVLEEEVRLQRKIDELLEQQSKLAAGLWNLGPQDHEDTEMTSKEQG